MTTLEADRPTPLSPQELGRLSFDKISQLKTLLHSTDVFVKAISDGFFSHEIGAETYYRHGFHHSYISFDYGSYRYGVEYEEAINMGGGHDTQNLEIKKFSVPPDLHDDQGQGHEPTILGSLLIKTRYNKQKDKEYPEFMNGRVLLHDGSNPYEDSREAFEKIQEVFDEIFTKRPRL